MADPHPSPLEPTGPAVEGGQAARIALGVLVLLAVIVVSLPLASAFHLSLGASDAVASVQETPSDPSVPSRWHDIGTRTSTCYQADPNVPEGTTDELQRAVSKQGFCGELVFEQGTPLEQESPPDQDLRDPILSFDAMFTTYVGTHQTQTCLPWCYPPQGQAAYEGANDLGAAAGLTPPGEQAWEEDEGWQEYAVNLAIANPTLAAGQQLGTHPMNGWIFPVYDQTIVAFLRSHGGSPVDDEDLASLVDALKTEGDLPPRAVPSVCGFTPDGDIQPQNEPSSPCEVEFRWVGPADPDEHGSTPCASETYVCGAAAPHWQARVTCVMAATSCGAPARSATPAEARVEASLVDDGFVGDALEPPAPPGSPPGTSTPRPAGPLGGPGGRTENSDPPTSADSTTRYVRWHFVVAPTISPCSGLVDPGVAFQPGAAPDPYLAYDLDVFTPVAHTTPGPTDGFANVRDWATAIAREAAGQADDETPQPQEIGGGTALPAEDARRHVAKTWKTEPNAPGDTSKELVRIDRDNPCTQIQGTTETSATLDPWVNVVDSRVTSSGQGVDTYGNARSNQSAGNRPGPGWYTTQGMTGLFADPDDDGDYEQASSSTVFSDIMEVGAYPMFWDMRLDHKGNIDPDAGCRMTDRTLTEMMAEAGYGPRTGLIQIVLLHEGADWYYRDDSTGLEHENVVGLDERPGATDPNAYLFMSQGLWQLWERGDRTVEVAVEAMLHKLPGDRYDVWPSTRMLEPPPEGRSDFYPQCNEGTGGFTSRWDFTHHCLEEEPASCKGDTVATAYLYENADGDGTLGGAAIPAFQPAGAQPFDGFTGSDPGRLWIDVDPLDNDPERNTNDGSPPTGED